jgi:hypothetical protein
MGDLDAHGIRIIGNLADRIGRPITPVATATSFPHSRAC